MRLWMGNIAPDTTDEEITALIMKYASELTCKSIQRVDGAGSRPGAIVELDGGKFGDEEKLSLRLNGIHWKGRALVCQKMIT
jgi:hypothetical protein